MGIEREVEYFAGRETGPAFIERDQPHGLEDFRQSRSIAALRISISK